MSNQQLRDRAKELIEELVDLRNSADVEDTIFIDGMIEYAGLTGGKSHGAGSAAGAAKLKSYNVPVPAPGASRRAEVLRSHILYVLGCHGNASIDQVLEHFESRDKVVDRQYITQALHRMSHPRKRGALKLAEATGKRGEYRLAADGLAQFKAL